MKVDFVVKKSLKEVTMKNAVEELKAELQHLSGQIRGLESVSILSVNSDLIGRVRGQFEMVCAALEKLEQAILDLERKASSLPQEPDSHTC